MDSVIDALVQNGRRSYTLTIILGVLTFGCLLVALDIMGLFSEKDKFPVDGRTVIITGGSQGMGRALGKLLAQKGANVVIVARNKEKLSKALEYISAAAKDKSRQRFHAISADVTSPEENQRILTETTIWNNSSPPNIVWANAGAAASALFVDTPLSTLRSQMEINYWAAAYLAHATLQAWLKPDPPMLADSTKEGPGMAPRHFIMTSSSVAFVGVAGYAPYAPAKAALRSLADSLCSEVNLYNGWRRRRIPATTSPSTRVDPEAPPADIKVHIVLPGTILSPGLENENLTKHPVTEILEDGDPQQTEDEVAAAAIKGLERGEYMITTQFLGHAMRASAMGGSPRGRIVFDTVLSWITSIVWLFIGPDLEGKVWNYGKKNGNAKVGKSSK